jgi:hypothetical protein
MPFVSSTAWVPGKVSNAHLMPRSTWHGINSELAEIAVPTAWFGMEYNRRKTSISFEALVGLFVALLAGVAELSWELRTLGVLFASLVSVHIAKRFDGALLKKIVIAAAAIGLLLISTWRPTWKSFHEDFPTITGETVLSRIIIFVALFAAGLAAYAFLFRSRREGRRLIPAQLMAFGMCLVALGAAAGAIGLLWQFQQNREMEILSKVGPNLLPAPDIPQIAQTPVLQALPAPEPQSQQAVSLMSGYGLTAAGIRVLAEEAFKMKGILPGLTVYLQTNDETGRGLATSITRALSRGGIPSTINFGQLGGPSETGPIILFDDPKNLPEPAARLKAALEKVGMRVTVLPRPVGTFQFYVGPDPNS